MGKLVDELLTYLSETSSEQLAKDWDELKEFNEIGPEVASFIKYSEEFMTQVDNPMLLEVIDLNELENPEFTLDFFYLAA